VYDVLPLQSTPVNPTNITIDSDFLPMVKEVRHAAAQSVPPVAAPGGGMQYQPVALASLFVSCVRQTACLCQP
jgi:hypothetical protein